MQIIFICKNLNYKLFKLVEKSLNNMYNVNKLLTIIVINT